VIGAGSTVNPNVRIWPNKEVEPGAVVRESIIWLGVEAGPFHVIRLDPV